HGKEAIAYDLPEMEAYLAETYGITVYQEQVMLLAQKLGGFSKGDADVLRKAMGKKQKSTLDYMKKQFVDGAAAKGHPADKLEKIWTDWEAFAQYAFNKSHSTCYAYVAYQTAYLKAHYPADYMSAVLNNAGSIEKITFFMEECKRMGIHVLGPDINESQIGFAVNKAGEIRFGLGGLKGVGEAAVESIIEEREKKGPYRDVFDLIKRINQRTVNKKSLESLIYSGAFDCFREFHRAQYFHIIPGDMHTALERIISFGNRYQNNLTQNSNTLFGDSMLTDVPVPKIQSCEEWTLTQKLDYEKEVTGMFISGHPLDHFRFEINYYKITPIADFNEFKDAIKLHHNPFQQLRLAGLVAEANHRISKTGKQFGIFTLEDYSGKMELALFGEDYVRFKEHFKPGSVLYITGNFKNRWNKTDEFDFKVSGVLLLETVKRTLTKQLIIETDPRFLTIDVVQFFEQNIRKNPGRSVFKLQLSDPTENLRVKMQTLEKGFEMNDDMAQFLLNRPDLEVQVIST
ncbi:MAG: DNA polymerase III subunit alpha, partial [Bacteroidetes bacterium]|nr:DNA polymerase III subunit alpha [Bacteroidota bacterium]